MTIEGRSLSRDMIIESERLAIGEEGIVFFSKNSLNYRSLMTVLGSDRISLSGKNKSGMVIKKELTKEDINDAMLSYYRGNNINNYSRVAYVPDNE